MKLILLSTDLMISSFVAGVARQHELEVVTVGNQSAAMTAAHDDEARVMVADLRCPGLDIGELVTSSRKEASSSVRIVAFGPHVHETNLNAARESGCDAVATRGQFDREAGAIIGQLLEA